MTSWFSKFRISAAIDSGKPLSESLRGKIARSAELRHFAANARACHDLLAQSPPAVEPPPFLHGSIMGALRAAPPSPAPVRRPVMALRFAAVLLLAAALSGAVWLGRRPAAPRSVVTAREPSLAAAAAVLEMTGEMPRAIPAQIVAPLSNEWTRLDLDLKNAGQFLLASLP